MPFQQACRFCVSPPQMDPSESAGIGESVGAELSSCSCLVVMSSSKLCCADVILDNVRMSFLPCGVGDTSHQDLSRMCSSNEWE